MNQNRSIIKNGSLAIESDKILDLGSTEQLANKYEYDIIIDANKMAIIPGLMDGHAHAGHSLLRTLGMHNNTWYKACEEIYAKGSTLDYWEADAALLYLERLKFGILRSLLVILSKI